jgi:hypothetical protein
VEAVEDARHELTDHRGLLLSRDFQRGRELEEVQPLPGRVQIDQELRQIDEYNILVGQLGLRVLLGDGRRAGRHDPREECRGAARGEQQQRAADRQDQLCLSGLLRWCSRLVRLVFAHPRLSLGSADPVSPPMRRITPRRAG